MIDPSHFTIGVFVCTFTYALVVLLSLRIPAGEDDDTAAGVSITLAFGLAVLSLVTFAIYANHIVHSVRISSIVDRIGSQTREAIEALYPQPFRADGVHGSEPAASLGEPDRIIPADKPGVLVRWDADGLLDAASRYDLRIRLVPKPGQFLPEGAPLLEIYGARSEGEQRLRKHVTLAAERSLERDVNFGLRQLSDIAIRAMSSGIDDPATAVEATDQIHDLLRRLVTRDLAHGSQMDGRVFFEPLAWHDVMAVAVEEIAASASGSHQVAAHLRHALMDIEQVAPPDRKGSIRCQVELIDNPADHA